MASGVTRQARKAARAIVQAGVLSERRRRRAAGNITPGIM